MNDHWVPNRMVLAGVGVLHEDLVFLARAVFGPAQPVTTSTAKAQYTGGDVRVGDENSDASTFAVAFEAGVCIADACLSTRVC